MAKKKRKAMNMSELTEIVTSVYSSIGQYASHMERIFGEGSYVKVMGQAFSKITDPMYEDMRRFVSPGQHNRSDKTLKSLNRGELTLSDGGDRLYFKLGFDMNKGGFPALILEYGDSGSPMRMPNKAYFFVYYAVRNHSYSFAADEENEIFRPIFEELASEAKKIGQ